MSGPTARPPLIDDEPAMQPRHGPGGGRALGATRDPPLQPLLTEWVRFADW